MMKATVKGRKNRPAAQAIKAHRKDAKSSHFAASLSALALAVSALFAGASCGARSGSNQVPAAAKQAPATAFEKDLNYARNGRFSHIYVIARQDGDKFQSEDFSYLKANAPRETNMWLLTDERHRVIAATNFEFTPENFDALRKKFTVEDYTGK